MKPAVLIITVINMQNSAVNDELPEGCMDPGSILEPPYITARQVFSLVDTYSI
ncbi:MAG: hypothetical protein KAT47_02620 [Candidatus Aegiribacteria sp.]|nr:hypothetical protein [Candidatus Aegiribacteria sp.]